MVDTNTEIIYLPEIGGTKDNIVKDLKDYPNLQFWKFQKFNGLAKNLDQIIKTLIKFLTRPLKFIKFLRSLIIPLL